MNFRRQAVLSLVIVLTFLAPTGVALAEPTLVTVSGVVRNPSGSPLPNIGVLFDGPGGTDGEVTDSTGRYTFEVPPGTGALWIHRNNDTPVPGVPPDWSVRADLTVTTDTTLDLTLPPTINLAVRVVDHQGIPVPGAAVSTSHEAVTPFDLAPGVHALGYNQSAATTGDDGIAHLPLFPTPDVDITATLRTPTTTITGSAADIDATTTRTITIRLGMLVREAFAPALLQATARPRGITLTWYPPKNLVAGDALAYRVYSGPDRASLGLVAELPPDARGFEVTAPAGTTHEFAVVAVTAFGEGRRGLVSATTPELVALTAAPSSVALAPGEAVAATAGAAYSDGTAEDVTAIAAWSSSNTAVVSVAEDGTLLAKAAGEATITAMFDGEAATIVVSVRTRTTLAADPGAYLSAARLFVATARLTEESGEVIDGAPVEFLVNGVVVCRPLTKQGVAECRVRVTQGSPRPTAYIARFTGDAQYAASTKSAEVI